MRYTRLLLNGCRNFFRNQSLLPFETMWAFFCVYVSVVNVFKWGTTASPLTRALGTKTALAFNVAFCLAGLSIYFGIGLKRGNIEACGLILLMMSLIVATIVNGWLFGLNPAVINAYILNGAFIVSCLIRLLVIIHWPRGATEIMSAKNDYS
jgi:hypothetical protein